MEQDPQQSELERLRREIDTLPLEQQGPLLELYAETAERQEQIRRSSEQSQAALRRLGEQVRELGNSFVALDNALQDLRLVAKMALFDLEVRRREQGETSDPPAEDPRGGDEDR